MAATPFKLDDVDKLTVRIGASVGVAMAPPGISAAQLRERADAALYQAKRLGKGAYSIDAGPPVSG
jgi:predicted signal transduction protein with EAL and GGDEF domain